MANVQAIRASDFINSIGINTHIDFTWTAYGNIQRIIDSLNYIGVKHVRDSANNPADIGPNGWWQKVADATGIKFDAFIGSGSPAMMQAGLQYIQQLAPQNIIEFVEGGNEEDNTYAASLGNTLAITAQFQQEVYAVGHAMGVPVINMSFGTGWAQSPNTGNYDKVGDISAYSDYANGHIYFGTGNPPSSNITLVNDLAQISSKHPVIATEMGWYTTGTLLDPTSVSETVQAKYMLDGLMDAYKAGIVKTYLYELLDQQTGDGYSENNFGLFHSDGTPKAAATALHNLTTLMADTGSGGSTFSPSALGYSLSGLQSTDNSLLMQKSDGSFWLSVWNETRLSGAITSSDITVPNHTITLTLDNQASSITVYDPMVGINAIQTVSSANMAQISLPDHPILVKIIPGAVTLPPISDPVSNSNDLTVTASTSGSTMANGTIHVTASINDPWAATHPGYMALNVTVNNGTVTMNDGSGHAIGGSGTGAIHVSGTLAELNQYLSTMDYHAPDVTGMHTLSVNVWNQAGVEVTKLTSINVTPSIEDISVTAPSNVYLSRSQIVQVTGISIMDEWAQSAPGIMALNITANNGMLKMVDSTGHAVAGSGTHTLHVTGTLAQLNAELATLTYQASSTVGSDVISINPWNQAGVSTTQTIAVNTLLAGNVYGSTGNDILSTTKLGSTLTGGSGADTFYFTKTNTGTGTRADHIADFSQTGGDKIDLHGFGLTAANFNSTGNLTGSKSFTYKQLTDANSHPYTLVKFDTNGDHVSDREIYIDNGHITLHANDFIFV